MVAAVKRRSRCRDTPTDNGTWCAPIDFFALRADTFSPIRRFTGVTLPRLALYASDSRSSHGIRISSVISRLCLVVARICGTSPTRNDRYYRVSPGATSVGSAETQEQPSSARRSKLHSRATYRGLNRNTVLNIFEILHLFPAH